MLAVATETLQVVDFGVLLVGGLIALALGIALLVSGKWRNPLAGAAPPPAGEHAWMAVAAGLLTWMVITNVALTLLVHDKPENITQPGSDAWHRTQTCDAIGKLAATAVMLAYIARARKARDGLPIADMPQRSRLTALRLTAVVVCGMLATTGVVTIQLYAGEIVWRWLHPDAVPPVHQVLVALKDSAWNRAPASAPWGTIQLFVAAVVVAPLAEEVFFRGVLLPALYQSLGHAWLSILISGVVFGGIHGSQPQDVLPLSVFGVALGFVRVRYRCLPACVLIHALFNARTMVLATLAPELINT
jgi:membrane protease YdiL (CAAX protease family)